MRKDVFIAHASEDKDDIARPLTNALIKAGLKVWYDEYELFVGDDFVEEIEKGCAQSRFGILIISPQFLKKHWTGKERRAFEIQEEGGVKKILPILHNMTFPELKVAAPFLASRVMIESSKGIDQITKEMLRVIRPFPKSQRRAQMEQECFYRCFHYRGVCVPAIRLIGAAEESFAPDQLIVQPVSEVYALPPRLQSDRHSIIAFLEEEARRNGRVFFNGPCVRLWDHSVSVVDPAKENKRLELLLGPLGYHDYAVARYISDEALLDDGTYNLSDFLDLEGLVTSLKVTRNNLSNIVDTATTLITSDGMLIYTQRSRSVQAREMWFTSAIAETIHAEKDKVVDITTQLETFSPFRTVMRGIEEELSPRLRELIEGQADDSLLCLGMSFDLEGFHPDLLFLVLLSITYEEVQRICLERPGKDFFEGKMMACDISKDKAWIVKILQSGQWTPGGAASVVRSIEFLDSVGNAVNEADVVRLVASLIASGQ